MRELAGNGGIGANVVDGLFAISRALYAVADAIKEHHNNDKGVGDLDDEAINYRRRER